MFKNESTCHASAPSIAVALERSPICVGFIVWRSFQRRNRVIGWAKAGQTDARVRRSLGTPTMERVGLPPQSGQQRGC